VINYGLNKVRFLPRPLKVGQRYRLAMKLVDAKAVTGGVEALMQGPSRSKARRSPVCAAEIVFRFMA